MLMYSPQNEELAPLTQYCHPMQCRVRPFLGGGMDSELEGNRPWVWLLCFVFVFVLLLPLSGLPQLETGPTKINGSLHLYSIEMEWMHGRWVLTFIQYRDGMNAWKRRRQRGRKSRADNMNGTHVWLLYTLVVMSTLVQLSCYRFIEYSFFGATDHYQNWCLGFTSDFCFLRFNHSELHHLGFTLLCQSPTTVLPQAEYEQYRRASRQKACS